MVAPKKVCFKDEDKSPSPQPFEEPEGMVTIDLNIENASKKEGNNSTNLYLFKWQFSLFYDF